MDYRTVNNKKHCCCSCHHYQYTNNYDETPINIKFYNKSGRLLHVYTLACNDPIDWDTFKIPTDAVYVGVYFSRGVASMYNMFVQNQTVGKNFWFNEQYFYDGSLVYDSYLKMKYTTPVYKQLPEIDHAITLLQSPDVPKIAIFTNYESDDCCDNIVNYRLASYINEFAITDGSSNNQSEFTLYMDKITYNIHSDCYWYDNVFFYDGRYLYNSVNKLKIGVELVLVNSNLIILKSFVKTVKTSKFFNTTLLITNHGDDNEDNYKFSYSLKNNV